MFDEFVKTLDRDLQDIYSELKEEPGNLIDQLNKYDTEALLSILKFVRHVKEDVAKRSEETPKN